MEKVCLSILLVCVLFFSSSTFVKYSRANAPALYVFGDSFYDPGNLVLYNNGSISEIQSPYGVDLDKNEPRKFTNGRTTIDFLDQFLGLPNQPPIMKFQGKSVPNDFDHQGVNFAFGTSGIILDEMPNPMTKRSVKFFNLAAQVRSFKNTLKNILPLRFKSKSEIALHLSQSIFIIQSGFNDYGFSHLTNFLMVPPALQSLVNLAPENFAKVLVKNLGKSLEELHKLGARKFVVFELPPFDCFPVGLNRTDGKARCDKPNGTVPTFYNSELASILDDLQSKFSDSTFILGKTYNFYMDLIQNPTRYGINDASNACCELDPGRGFVPCIDNSTACEDRNSHAFFDSVHPTEATYKLIAKKCFQDTDLCVPMNIHQLADN